LMFFLTTFMKIKPTKRIGSRKKPPKRKLKGGGGGGGGSKAQILKGKYEPKLKFPEGLGGGDRGLNHKTLHGKGMDIFWNNTISKQAN